MIVLKIGLILILSYILGKVTTRLIKIFDKLSKNSGIGKFGLTALIMALLTSLPEILVAISSSLQGVNKLSLVNAMGANIVNLSFVIGITAIVAHSLHFHSDKQMKDNLKPLFYTLAPFLLLADGELNRIDSFILLTAYGVYVLGLLKNSAKREENELSYRQGKISILVLELIFWAGLMVGTTEVIVRLAQNVALDLKLPLIFIGLFLVSLGTTLPELVFNIKTAKKKEVSMSLGNVIGSCVTNSTLILGLAALISPIVVENMSQIWLPAIEYAFVAMLLMFFIRSKHRLDSWEGVILVVIFAYYTSLSWFIK